MTPPLVDELTALLGRTRDRTSRLVAHLSDEQLHAQPIDFLSPVIWDIAHVGNVEELWLVRQLGGSRLAPDRVDRLYDAFEQPRGVRGGLPLLNRTEAAGYLVGVRDETLSILRRIQLDPDDPLLRDGHAYRMIAQHESQHQETVVQSLMLRGGQAACLQLGDAPTVGATVDDTERVPVPGGSCLLGTDTDPWAFDNERRAHHVEVGAFTVDRYPVTTRRYAAFVRSGGYQRPELWTRRGWSWCQQTGHTAPQGWLPGTDGDWRVRRGGREQLLDPREPVQHISWFEADAFARWAGGRLPTEAEWEKLASWDPAAGAKRRYPWGEAPVTVARANVGLRRGAPDPVGSHPAGASAYGAEQLAGDVYEWTSSRFEPYPGFTAFPYREYSEAHFGDDHRVLRGASWAIDAPFARTTYRNWDHPWRRQLLAGCRVAYDVRR